MGKDKGIIMISLNIGGRNYDSKTKTNIIDYFRNRKNRKKHLRNTDNTVKLH